VYCLRGEWESGEIGGGESDGEGDVRVVSW
jgi:hypothetical protein